MSGLEFLHAEVIELIVMLLSFQDICNLRLVSKDISSKSSHGLIKSQFAAKTVAWTSIEELENFVQQTRLGWRGCLFQNLTIVGMVEATIKEELARDLLTKAFRSLRVHSPRGSLNSLTLLVHGQTAEGEIISCSNILNWTQIWNTSARTFSVVFEALATSGIPVWQLNVFANEPRCSLACDQIRRKLVSPKSTPNFYQLTHLSLSVSHRLLSNDELEAGRGMVDETKYVDGLFGLISLCRDLHSLDLHWYNLGVHRENGIRNMGRDPLQYLLELEVLKTLQECRLRGLFTNGDTLLDFVQSMPQLCSLAIEEMHLDDGKFGPALDYLTSQEKHIEHLHLDDLWEDGRLVCFDAPGKPHFRSRDNLYKPHDIIWPGRGRPRKIKYRIIQRGPLGSSAFFNWQRKKILEYGPPRFTLLNLT